MSMKTTTRRPRQRLNEKLGDYNARLREWLERTNAHRYALQHAEEGGEISEEEANRNLEALAAKLAEEPLPPTTLAPSHNAPQGTGNVAPSSLELDHLHNALQALTNRVVELEKLVAASVAYRSLKPSAKAKVDAIDPSVGAAFKDRRSLLALTIYDHVANMGGKKKANANFPKDLRDRIVDYSGEKPDEVCRVIPYTALLHRLAAKKDFRPSVEERSSQENARRAIEKSGLVVTTMHEAGIRQGSALLVVMDHAEAVKRGLVKGLPAAEPCKVQAAIVAAKPKPKPDPVKAMFAEWGEDEPATTPPVDEPATTSPVDDNEEIDNEPWEEEEEQPDEDFILFRAPGEEKKSSKAVDLFAD